MAFDFGPLVPAGSPVPAARWTGLAKFSFIGGNNDPDGVPVDGLKAAIDAVLTREGKSLATYNLGHGPQGYRPLREFLVRKLKRDLMTRLAGGDFSRVVLIQWICFRLDGPRLCGRGTMVAGETAIPHLCHLRV